MKPTRIVSQYKMLNLMRKFVSPSPLVRFHLFVYPGLGPLSLPP